MEFLNAFIQVGTTRSRKYTSYNKLESAGEKIWILIDLGKLKTVNWSAHEAESITLKTFLHYISSSIVPTWKR